MQFKNMFKYETKDGVFKIVDLPSTLSRELCLDKLKAENKRVSWVNKEITENKITVYNTLTNRWSDKSLYLNDKGRFYFKGIYDAYYKRSKRFYIDEVKPCEETIKCED